MGSKGGAVTDIGRRFANVAVSHEEERGKLPLAKRVRDTRGKFLTIGLFLETADPRTRYAPLYCLGETDTAGLPSARRIYLELCDPTEYQAAMALVGSWDHWCYLCGLSWFKPYVEAWRAELRSKLKSRAVEIAKELARGNDATALSASKWLHAQLSAKAVGGRPRKNKPDVSPEAEDTDLDYARITEQVAEDIQADV